MSTGRIRRGLNEVKEFDLKFPATSANLGPAFDAAALALDLWLRVKATPAKNYSIVATGRDQEICGRIENHLILDTYGAVLQAEQKPEIPLALRIHNEFPLGKGCGSSAAARLAGIALAVHFGRLGWKGSRIIGETSRREHHSDNAAACWMGGVAVSRLLADETAQVANFVPKARWPLLLAIPDESLPTQTAREVLPSQYSRQDAVSNIQNSMLLLAALFQGNKSLLASALEDRIHQPYREELCPLLPAIKKFPAENGVLGSALSGAGPSVLLFLDPAFAAQKTKAKLAKFLSERGMKAELVLTSIARRGAATSFRGRIEEPKGLLRR